MANWTKIEPQGTSQRKKWNLEDRTSLKNLKYQIAEDGCSEIQFDLAKQLLEEDDEANDNYAQGIKWLLRAANQGHTNSLNLLSECYKTGRGINDSNECEVEACLSMSPSERATRKAARELFTCLSNGVEYITVARLERKMRKLFKMKRRKPSIETPDSEIEENLPNNGRPSNDDYNDNDFGGSGDTGGISSSTVKHCGRHGQRCHQHRQQNIRRTNDDLYDSDDVVTEANLITAAVNYSNGYLPIVNNQSLTLSIPHPHTLDHIPYFHRLLFQPLLFFSLYFHSFINLFTALADTLLNNLYMFSIFIVYIVLFGDNVLMFIPLGIYYLSLIVMIITSFKMLKAKYDFIDFRMWSGLFISYGDHNVNAMHSENQFLRNNMKPYLYFFIAFFVNLVLNPIVSDDKWIPHSEITLISFILIFITMCTFMYSSSEFPDIYILFSFGINVLAKYPYEMDTVVKTGWRFLDLKIPNFPSFVIGNGIEFCLNCRAIFYLLIPVALFLLAHRRNWHGIYQYLIPHCVTLSWLQICIISSQCATMFGLIRATLGLAGLLLFLPLFGIITLMIPIFAVIEWLSLSDPRIRVLLTIVIVFFVTAISCVMAANQHTEKYITVIHVMLCIIGTAFLTLPYMTKDFKTSHGLFENLIKHDNNIADEHLHLHHHNSISDSLNANKLNWDTYYKYCNYPAWQYVNKINTQIRCSQLDGTEIKWEGTVSNIEIGYYKNIRNHLITEYIPEFLANIIKCYYGEPNESLCNAKERNCNDDIRKFIVNEKKCNINLWNIYEYDITLRMHTGLFNTPTDVMVRAQHDFGNFTQHLNTSDLIWFKGILRNNYFDSNNSNNNRYMILGKNIPIVDLLAIGCINCQNKDLQSYHMIDDHLHFYSRIQDLNRGIKYFLNVMFNPLVTFK